MKLYRSLNMIFLIIFIIGTALCFKYLPSEIPLFMQSPPRWVFVGICFVILLALAIAAFFPHKISKNDNEVRNDITLTRNFLNLGIIESRNYIRISYGSFLYAGTNGISPFS